MSDLEIVTIVLIALALSADCFAVSLSGSICSRTLSFTPILRTAFTFGIFQAIMPVLGWLLGRTFVDIIADYDHWVAFGLLVLIGGRMVWESFRPADSQKQVDISRGMLLIVLAVATSIDALAVGLTFAFLKVDIVIACVVIGVVAFGVTIIGFVLGRKAKTWLGKRAGALGGMLLIIIGIRILLTHMLQL